MRRYGQTFLGQVLSMSEFGVRVTDALDADMAVDGDMLEEVLYLKLDSPVGRDALAFYLQAEALALAFDPAVDVVAVDALGIGVGQQILIYIRG